MDVNKFKSAYEESRNGADRFIRHALNRAFAMSNGVQEVADVGCHWLIDIFATELPSIFSSTPGYGQGIATITVIDKQQAKIEFSFEDDKPLWSKHIDYTDMPEGTWNFMVFRMSETTLGCILLSEY